MCSWLGHTHDVHNDSVSCAFCVVLLCLQECMGAMLPEKYQSVGVCGYATTPAGCPNKTLSDFCDTEPKAKSWNGGINGSPTGYFGEHPSFSVERSEIQSSIRPQCDLLLWVLGPRGDAS